jgi:hypothetical protein
MSDSHQEGPPLDGRQGCTPSRKRDLPTTKQETQRVVRMCPPTMKPSSSVVSSVDGRSSPASSLLFVRDRVGDDEYIGDESWMDILFAIADNDVQELDYITSDGCQQQNCLTDGDMNNINAIMDETAPSNFFGKERIGQELLHSHHHLVPNDVDLQPLPSSSRESTNSTRQVNASSFNSWDQFPRPTIPLSCPHYVSTQPLYQSLSSMSSVPVVYRNVRPPSEGDLSLVTATESSVAEDEGTLPNDLRVNRTQYGYPTPSYRGMISMNFGAHRQPSGNESDSNKYSFAALRTSKVPT